MHRKCIFPSGGRFERKTQQACGRQGADPLKVGKISDGWSGYYYSLPESDLVSESEKSYIQDVRRGILSIEFSGNFGVIKTRPGHANSVCFALDVLNLPEILGSLAGDDTIFVILREGMTKEDLLESFQTRIPDLQDQDPERS